MSLNLIDQAAQRKRIDDLLANPVESAKELESLRQQLASRDAEVAKWRDAYEKAAEAALILSQERDQLRDLLRPFAALLQDHNRDGLDEQPIFQINGAKITRGDLRRALAATESKEQGE